MDILSYFNIVLPFLLLLESLVKDVNVYVSEIALCISVVRIAFAGLFFEI